MRAVMVLTTLCLGVILGRIAVDPYETHVLHTMGPMCEVKYRDLLPIQLSNEIWATKGSFWEPTDQALGRLVTYSQDIHNPWETILSDRFYDIHGYPAGQSLFRWGFDEHRGDPKVVNPDTDKPLGTETWKVMIARTTDCSAFGQTFVLLVDYEHLDKRPLDRHPLSTFQKLPDVLACAASG